MTTPHNRPLVSWMPAALWATMIFTLSSVPFGPPGQEPGFLERYYLDKPVHMVLFGTLAWLLLRALRGVHGLRLPVAIALSVLITSAYGASDEWHQSFVPGRFPSVSDWIADTCGAMIAVAIYYRHDTRTGSKANR